MQIDIYAILSCIVGSVVGVLVSTHFYNKKLQKIINDYDKLLKELAEYYQMLLVDDI